MENSRSSHSLSPFGRKRSFSTDSAIVDDIDARFCCSKPRSKSDVLTALEHCPYLHKIPLTAPTVSQEQAEKDFCRERVLLNDVAFVPDKHDADRARAFSLTLRRLCQRLSQDSSVLAPGCDSEMVSDLVMQRACRTSAGADSFFTVQRLLCVEGTFVAQKTVVDDPPIIVDIFLTPGLCARIQVSNCFAIYDVSAMDDLGSQEPDPQHSPHSPSAASRSTSSMSEPLPWLDVESVVVDESNFLTGHHCRRLHLLVTVPESGATFSSADEHGSREGSASGSVKVRRGRPPRSHGHYSAQSPHSPRIFQWLAHLSVSSSHTSQLRSQVSSQASQVSQTQTTQTSQTSQSPSPSLRHIHELLATRALPDTVAETKERGAEVAHEEKDDKDLQ